MAMALALGAVMLYKSDIGWYIWYVGGGGLRLSLDLVQGHGNVPSSSSEKGQKGLNGFAPIWG